MALMEYVLLIVTVLGFAYCCVRPWVWTIGIAVVLTLVSLIDQINSTFLTLCWIIFLVAVAFTHLTSLRRFFITRPLIDKLAKRMPSISNTEREAIEAGNVWWEKDLFCGRPDWRKLGAIPKPKLSEEEQDFLDDQVETLCSMISDWEITERNDLSPEIWNYLKQEGFLGMVIPKSFGGKGFSALMHSTVVMKIATRSVSAAVNTMVPNSLGPGELILHYGTEEQKNYYLPRLARGEEIPCFALTSPEAGSDAGSMLDTGIVCRGMHEGKEVIGIRLSWDKRYITLAPIATVLGLAFKLYDPQHLIGYKENIGITLCLVPTNHPSVEIGNRHWPMRLAFMNGPTRGKDVFIPLEWIIGGRGQAGQGWRMLMECLSIGRGISLPALSTACAKLSYRATGAYAQVRKQFNTPLSNFEGIGEALGNIGGYTYLLEACRQMTAGAVDLKIRPAITSAIAKYQMTEIARQIMTHAMDIHAGHAVQLGPRNVIGPAYIAMPVSITVEGANILTRNLIIFGQGAIRCHPFILPEVELFASTDESKYNKLDSLLVSHIGYFVSNLARSFCIGITGAWFVRSHNKGRTAHHYQRLTRMSAALALLADCCMMILGGNLKRKERISARLGDMLSNLYLASTVLKYFKDQGQPATDLDSVKWCVETCLHRIQIACDELFENFPVRGLGGLLRLIIFPWGRAYLKPNDKLHQRVFIPMLYSSEFRDRLTEHCYIGDKPTDPLNRLDTVLDAQNKLDPVLRKFQSAIRSGKVPAEGDFEKRVNAAVQVEALTSEERQALLAFNALLRDVIQVNEFSFDFKSIIT